MGEAEAGGRWARWEVGPRSLAPVSELPRATPTDSLDLPPASLTCHLLSLLRTPSEPALHSSGGHSLGSLVPPFTPQK